MLIAQVLPADETVNRDVPISDNNWLDAFRIPFGEWIKQTVDWINTELEWVTDSIRWPFQFLFDLVMNDNPTRDSIQSISWLWVVIGMFLLGSFVRNTRIGLMVASMTAVCGFLGQEYWEEVSKTFGMIIISVALCVLIGIPLGVLCGRFDGLWNVTRPTLDAMQTIHSFVWMIPFIFFFGIGNVSATMVTMTYALPPIVRLTNLGIRQVPEDVVEASRSYGANELRVLTDVQLPLARPAIMTGFNQTLLLAFSMLGIAAYIGADGLGRLIFRAINNVNIALGAGAGLTFFLCAVILDRISQPEQDDGLSLWVRIRMAFDYRRDPEGMYLANASELAEPSAEPEVTEYPEPILAPERLGLFLTIVGSAIAAVATLLPWSNDAGGVSSWGNLVDENRLGESFSGLDASGGSFFGILVLGLSIVAAVAALRPLITVPGSVSLMLNRLQGLGLALLTGLLAIAFVLNLADVGFDGVEVLALLVVLAIALLIAADTFARGAPRLANDGALIMSLAAFAVAFAWIVLQPSPAVTDYSDGIGGWLALLGSAIAVGGSLMSVLRAPYASRVPLPTGFVPSTAVIAGIAGVLTLAGATAAWIVDERAGADVTNRVFHRGLSSDGPLMGWPVVLFGLIGVAIALVVAVSSPQGALRWRLGAMVTGLGLAVMALSLAFTLSISRNGDTDYLNDKNALTGAGILLAITAGGALFALGRGVLGDFRRKQVYLGEGPAPEAVVAPVEEASAADLAGVAS